ncbi:SgcJ/EcaC family oxidoreductase [Solicola gregarius]|uniref:SgcJ/EcaC family oxidoreductase n=1 Tax=Solicola gregarius TaxID=2908642 RepID=A0AA46TGT3_9ACTN|nr:SgcJ/EcaC family oxidoreductase [Solicola gregarius]UYM04866.1 SgcJ/EcaC family oxidoreductase [Solicola gregarius]
MDIHPATAVRERAIDVDVILGLVADFEHAQQNERVDDFVALFGENPVWTTGHGKRLDGLEEIASFTAKVLPGAMREATQRYDVARIAFIGPDVAIVNVEQTPITHDGRVIEGAPTGRPFWVLAQDTEWRIVGAQNTQVVEA